jgi:Flp pilus assembly protein TadD
MPCSRRVAGSAHASMAPMSGRHVLAALLLSIALGVTPVRADDLADVQRLAGAGDLIGALQRADRALLTKPRDAQLRFARGVLLADLKRDAEAIAVFVQLNEDYPELPDPLNNLAVLHAAQGRLDEARTALEAALRNDAQHRTARENLADVYLRLAVRLWDGLVASSPADPAIVRKLRLGRELLRSPG